MSVCNYQILDYYDTVDILNLVHGEVLSEFIWSPALDHWMPPKKWERPSTDIDGIIRADSCGFMMECYERLKEESISPHAMHWCVVLKGEAHEDGVKYNHPVLCVYTDNGELILDHRLRRVTPIDQIGYTNWYRPVRGASIYSDWEIFR